MSGRTVVTTILIFVAFRFEGAQIPRRADAYDLLLHSATLTEQRAALTTIIEAPQMYVPRIRQTLKDYPRLVRRDWSAANRAVDLAALVRDRSFAGALVGLLGNSEVESQCAYACPVVFALTIHAAFGGWTPPRNLDVNLTTVGDLQAAIRRVPAISLQTRPISDFVSGPGFDRVRNQIDGKTEAQLIALAGPATSSFDLRFFAATALEASVSTSTNRIELYLLAMNNDRADASSEYLGAIHEAIYRSELARSHGR